MKKDRFKEIEIARTSKAEGMLVKRLATTMTRQEEQNSMPMKNIKPSNRKYDENEEFGGEISDIWGTGPTPYKSKKFAHYRNTFAKTEHIKVK